MVILGAIDAAFSGDWSRTGVLTTANEDQLKVLLGLLAAFHCACAVAVASIAPRKGRAVAPAVLKVTTQLTRAHMRHIRLPNLLEEYCCLCRQIVSMYAPVVDCFLQNSEL